MSKRDFGTIKSLLHFDYPYFAELNDGLDDEIGLEGWVRTGNTKFAGTEIPYEIEGSPKFGYRCACFPDLSSGIVGANRTRIFNLNPTGRYELECFVKVDYATAIITGYSFYNGHTFKYFSTTATWSNAETVCESLGGHLATSTSAGKNEFLMSLANGIAVWLGATDTETESTWKWVTGEDWDSGVPASNSSSKDYVYMKTDGTFAVDSNSATYTYICEWDYDMRNEPSNIVKIGDALKLSLTPSLALMLEVDVWNISQTSSATLTAETWQHILLRLSGGNAEVYLNGSKVIDTAVIGNGTITPSKILLGGYLGYMDEFVFRHSAGSGIPVVPSRAYSGTSNVNSVGGFGNGSDGDITISTEDTQINSYGIISSVRDAGTFYVSTWSNSTSEDYGRPSVGSEVMIHITAPISTTAASYPYVGLYAFGRIAEIYDTGITLEKDISIENGYDFTLSSDLLSTYYVQVITVPNFESLTVNEEATIIPQTWSTTTGGGIVAFRCTGDCTVNGSILVQGCGAKRYDLQQMTHSKLIDRFLCGSGGGIFITCGGTFTAIETARLGATWSGAGKGGTPNAGAKGGNGGAGYGGAGGSDTDTTGTGGNGGVGGGGGGGDGNGKIGGDAGTSGTGGYGYSTTYKGGTQGTTAGGNSPDYSSYATGGAGAGGSSGSYGTKLAGVSSGACLVILARTFSASSSSISTGGEGGNATTYATGGGGTGFCYISCGEQVSANA